MSATLSHPAAVKDRLDEIERDLATRQNEFEAAALAWFLAKRERKKAHAVAFLNTSGSVAERNAVADEETEGIGAEHEAAYEAHKAVVDVLDTRAAIGMALLKSQGRS